MSQIDAIDERILTELQANGRLTMKALAERVGLSSPAMIERVRRLEDRGVIAGYRAVIKPATLGRPLTAVIQAEVSGTDAPQFLAAIESEAGVVEVLRLTGRYNYQLRAHVADSADLADLLDRLGASGARLEASIILAAPLEWRAVSSSGAPAAPSGRPRRRRRGVNGDVEKTRTPGRPRRPRPADTVA